MHHKQYCNQSSYYKEYLKDNH
uniref:Uncharacterized protein n=1 Tax=Anguilla anguilla TaxID=7936 RepID=A0A0E9QG25_ANGAN